MATPLSERLSPCGPVIDVGAAKRAREALGEAAQSCGWRATLEGSWPALAPIFAASPYLLGLARQTPERLRRVLDANPDSLAAAIVEQAGPATLPTTSDAAEQRLRELKGDIHLLTAVADLGGAFSLGQVTGAMSAFAQAALRTAVLVAAREAVSLGRLTGVGVGDEGPVPGLFFIGMGKLGAFELNYSSDIDLMVFHDPEALPVADHAEADAFAARFTERVADLLRRRTPAGYVFRVDLRLRPDPSSTFASVSVPAALEYYESVGQNWERAALIKARPIAGDLARARAFLAELSPFVWRRNLDFAAIADIHAIKRQIHGDDGDNGLASAGADLKLGEGGIREIEFYVQTQQLVLGGRDAGLRARGTLEALAALGHAGHAPSQAVEDLADSYRELRRLEHRIQMVGDEQSHRLPRAAEDRRAVAALAGAASLRRFDADVVALRRIVRRRCGALFVEQEGAASRLGPLIFTGPEIDPATTQTLVRMGFTDPDKAATDIRIWGHGHIAATRTERGREAFNRLAPRLMEACSATGAPDLAFSRFSLFFCGLAHAVQIQSLFLAKPKLLELVIRIMALAPQLARTLARRPAALDALLDPDFFSPHVDRDAIAAEIAARGEFEAAMDLARRLHRETAFRIAVQVLEGGTSAEIAGRAFAALADGIIAGLAPEALQEVERRGGALDGDVAVVALGKCGSAEMNMGSDLDLMTLYRGAPDAASARLEWTADTFFTRFTQRLVAALSAPTAEGELYAVDLQLRPSGTKGPVAVSLAAFASYYAAEAEVWELLAMTRARVVWASSEAFAATTRAAIETALRHPRDPDVTARDVWAMRELMARERPARGFWDMKLSEGGAVDIEFSAQLLALTAAPTGGPLRQNTLETLAALAKAGVFDEGKLDALSEAFRLQQNLTQVLKLALSDGADPTNEPKGLHELLARAADAPRFSQIRPRLMRARKTARSVFLELVRAPKARFQEGES